MSTVLSAPILVRPLQVGGAEFVLRLSAGAGLSTIHIFCALFFTLSAALLFAAERFKESKEALSRRAAMGSLACVMVAGVLFVMDVPRIGALMQPWGSEQHAGGKQQGEEGDDEEEEEGQGGTRKARRPQRNGAATTTQQAPATGAKLGEEDGDEDENDSVKDCEGCPRFVTIPPGSTRIGAEADDATATLAEKPARMATIWPGFAVSRRPISKAHFERFLEATGRRMKPCPEKDNGPKSMPYFGPDVPPAMAPMTCVTYEYATAYAGWLSARTGKKYRLPTAAEWEYVARGVRQIDDDALPTQKTAADPKAIGKWAPGNTPLATRSAPVAKGWKVHGMRLGVAEIVADCWSERLDVSQETAGKTDCSLRIIKGSSGRGDDLRWQEPWARRPFSGASTNVGFRVIRLN